MFKRYIGSVMPLAALALACSDVPSESPSSSLPTPNQVALSGPQPSGSDGVPAFLISFERSQFNPGASPRELEEFGFRKVSGTQGTYAHDPITGLILAKPSATAEATKRPPFGGSLAEHGERARAYFVAAGLPSNEMGVISGAPLLHAGGHVDDPPVYEVQAYFTLISRQANGVPVIDSRAVARINADGDIVHMMLHWPRIPSTVIASAERMRTIVSNDVTAFRSRMPADIDWTKATANVVIRHFPGFYRKNAYVYASYDVSVPGPQAERHFAESGAEFRLPSELEE